MATIWRAVDEQLDREVAVKLLRPQFSADPGFAARFKQEARAAGGLSHPNIVSVYDYGTDGADGDQYIVMELVDGPRPRRPILRERGALSTDDAVRVAIGGGQRAGGRPPQGHRPPRREARQHPHHRRRRREGDRLRHRPRRRRGVDDGHRHDARIGPLLQPRAGARRRGDRRIRRLRAGHRAVRDAHRPATVRGRLGRGGRAQAPQRGCAHAASDRRRGAVRPRGDRHAQRWPASRQDRFPDAGRLRRGAARLAARPRRRRPRWPRVAGAAAVAAPLHAARRASRPSTSRRESPPRPTARRSRRHRAARRPPTRTRTRGSPGGSGCSPSWRILLLGAIGFLGAQLPRRRRIPRLAEPEHPRWSRFPTAKAWPSPTLRCRARRARASSVDDRATRTPTTSRMAASSAASRRAASEVDEGVDRPGLRLERRRARSPSRACSGQTLGAGAATLARRRVLDSARSTASRIPTIPDGSVITQRPARRA